VPNELGSLSPSSPQASIVPTEELRPQAKELAAEEGTANPSDLSLWRERFALKSD